MLCKLNHIICDLLRLTFSTQHNALKTYPSCCKDGKQISGFQGLLEVIGRRRDGCDSEWVAQGKSV